jgi:hypothetical protein
VIKTLGASTGLDTDIFEKLLMLKAGLVRPKVDELHALFERYYLALESTGKIIDALHI